MEDQGLVVDDLHEDLFGVVEVGAIGDGGDNVEADDGLAGVVDKRFVGEFTVGHYDGAAVERLDGGVEYLDFTHIAFVRCTFDIVSDLERLHQQYDNTAGKVLQGALQCHTDGETHGTEEGDEGGGLNADDIHRHDDNHGLEQHVDQRAEEGFERRLGIAFLESADDKLFERILPNDIANIVERYFLFRTKKTPGFMKNKIETEVRIKYEGLTGIVDNLEWTDDGFYIWDYKITDEIKEVKFGKFKDKKYTLQQNFYRYILEKVTGKKCLGMNLLVWDGDAWRMESINNIDVEELL